MDSRRPLGLLQLHSPGAAGCPATRLSVAIPEDLDHHPQREEDGEEQTDGAER